MKWATTFFVNASVAVSGYRCSSGPRGSALPYLTISEGLSSVRSSSSKSGDSFCVTFDHTSRLESTTPTLPFGSSHGLLIANPPLSSGLIAWGPIPHCLCRTRGHRRCFASDDIPIPLSSGLYAPGITTLESLDRCFVVLLGIVKGSS